jgi:peptidyl-prolyl cis-trans isomerase B (cyclophilin B)
VNRARIIAVTALTLALTGCVAPITASPRPAATESAGSAPAAGGVNCQYQATGNAARAAELPPTSGVANTGTAELSMALSGGTVGLSLDRVRTPCTTNSFVSLASQGYFDKTSCHRLVDSGIFVLQCGDPSGTGSGGPGYQFADELTGDETYGAGTLAMANAGSNTNGSQFFIVYADSPLPPNYTVFGKVDGPGLKVIEKIAAAGQDNSFGQAGGGKPTAPAEIESIRPR